MEVYRPPGASGCGPQSDAGGERNPSTPRFRQVAVEGSSSSNPTVLQLGPDARLYVAQQSGLIKAYTVVRRGGRYLVTATEEIDDIARIPNHDDDGTSISDVDSIVDSLRRQLGL